MTIKFDWVLSESQMEWWSDEEEDVWVETFSVGDRDLAEVISLKHDDSVIETWLSPDVDKKKAENIRDKYVGDSSGHVKNVLEELIAKYLKNKCKNNIEFEPDEDFEEDDE